jgi:hypothetical protein
MKKGTTVVNGWQNLYLKVIQNLMHTGGLIYDATQAVKMF